MLGGPSDSREAALRGLGGPGQGCRGRGAGASRRRAGHLACEWSVEGQEGGCDWAFTLERKGTGVNEKKHFLWCSGRASHWGFPTRGRRPWPPSQEKVVLVVGSPHTARPQSADRGAHSCLWCCWQPSASSAYGPISLPPPSPGHLFFMQLCLCFLFLYATRFVLRPILIYRTSS